MSIPRIYVDFVEHSEEEGTLDKELESEPVMQYLHPLPQVELVIMEQTAGGANYRKFQELSQQLVEYAKSASPKVVGNPKLKIIYDIFSECKARELIFENQLYPRKVYYQIYNVVVERERHEQNVQSCLAEGKIRKASEEYCQYSWFLARETHLRNLSLSELMPKFLNENRIGSAYTRLGEAHLGILEYLKVEKAREVVLRPFNKWELKAIQNNFSFTREDYRHAFFYAFIDNLFDGTHVSCRNISFDLLKHFSDTEFVELEEKLEVALSSLPKSKGKIPHDLNVRTSKNVVLETLKRKGVEVKI